MAALNCVVCQHPLTPGDLLCPGCSSPARASRTAAASPRVEEADDRGDPGGRVCADPRCGASLPDDADRCPYCRTPIDGSPDGPTDSTPDTAAPAGSDVDWLPGELRARFDAVEPLPATGAEADLFVVDVGAQRLVLKLYRLGVHVDQEVHAILSSADVAHVVRIIEHGEVAGRTYELLEHVSGGELHDLQRRWGPALSSRAARTVLQELADALEHLHGLGLKHGDVKPANVLLRNEEPLDLVLTDFGLAAVADATLMFRGEARRSRRYAAPEQLTGAEGRSADVWALGVVVLELLLGYHPLEEFADATVDYHLMYRAWPVSPDLAPDEDWGRLLRGMLHRDPEQRWTIGEVQRWLAGHLVADVQEPVSGREATPPFEFEGRSYVTRSEVARALVANWRPGASRVEHGALRTWVHACGDDPALVGWLDELAEAPWSPDGKLLRAALRLDPELPLVFREFQVDLEALRGLAAQAVVADPQDPARRAVRSFLDDEAARAIAELTGSPQHEHLADQLDAEQPRLDAGFDLAAEDGFEVDDDVRQLARRRLLQVLVDPAERSRVQRQLERVRSRYLPAWYEDRLGGDATTADLVVAEGLREPVLERAEQQERAARQARLHARSQGTSGGALLARGSRVVVALAIGAATLWVPIAVLVGVGLYAAGSRYSQLVLAGAERERARGLGARRILRLPFELIRWSVMGIWRVSIDLLVVALLAIGAALVAVTVGAVLADLPADLVAPEVELGRRLMVPLFVASAVFLLIRPRDAVADGQPPSSFPLASWLGRRLRLAPLPIVAVVWLASAGFVAWAWVAGGRDPLTAYEAVAEGPLARVEAFLEETFVADGPPATPPPGDDDAAPPTDAEPAPGAESTRWAVQGAAELNVRAAPGTDASVLTTLREGESAIATGEEHVIDEVRWVELELDDGTIGWSSTRFLTEVDE